MLMLLYFFKTEVKLESGCFKPETPENGEMFVLWSGLLVQFRCKNADYKLVGAAAVICRNRTWTQDPPVCVHHHQLQAHLQQHQQQPSVGDNGELLGPQNTNNKFFPPKDNNK